MIRLFTGLPLPAPLRDRLALMQGGIDGARWTKPENYHITLTFIGNVDETTAQDIDEALLGVRAPSFDLTLAGADSFAQGDDPTVLWMGLRPEPALHRLKEKIDRAMEQRRLPFENRKYTPHVTQARFRKRADEARIAQFIREQSLFVSEPFHIDHFILYRTHQTKNGSIYEEAASYPLSPFRPD